MPKAKIRMINLKDATFIEVPNCDFCGRAILVQVLPTDDPGNVAMQCMKQLTEFGKRSQLAAIDSNIITPKIIKPN